MIEPAPDTVTEALAFLASEGYRDELGPVPLGASVVVDYTFRFEGPSDPADEAIVLGVRCPTQGTKAVLVSGFGWSADPEHAALLNALVRSRPS